MTEIERQANNYASAKVRDSGLPAMIAPEATQALVDAYIIGFAAAMQIARAALRNIVVELPREEAGFTCPACQFTHKGTWIVCNRCGRENQEH